MDFGSLRHRVMFQEEIKAADVYKGHDSSWRDVIAVWASIEPLRGSARFYAHQVTSEVTHKVKIRFREDVSDLMRIKYRERIFTIESMLDIKEWHDVLEILCKEEK